VLLLGCVVVAGGRLFANQIGMITKYRLLRLSGLGTP
jgi:hypothetical protein